MWLWSAARGPARAASKSPRSRGGTGRLHQPGRTTTSIWSTRQLRGRLHQPAPRLLALGKRRLVVILLRVNIWPTATHPSAFQQETPVRLTPLGAPPATAQTRPFQRSMTPPPTAVHAPAAGQDTAERPPLSAGCGVDSTDHRLPFHRSTSEAVSPSLFRNEPTAVHAVADEHDTADRFPAGRAGGEIGCTDQLAASARPAATRHTLNATHNNAARP